MNRSTFISSFAIALGFLLLASAATSVVIQWVPIVYMGFWHGLSVGGVMGVAFTVSVMKGSKRVG